MTTNPRPAPRVRALSAVAMLCLIAALVVQGMGAALVSMLGAKHSHLESSLAAAPDLDPMRGWVDFRRIDHVTDSVVQRHAHDHAIGARHPHDPLDATVVRQEGDADAATSLPDASWAGAGCVFVLAASMHAPAVSREAVALAWSAYVARRWARVGLRRRERPPMG